jgi:hypothetical protein
MNSLRSTTVFHAAAVLILGYGLMTLSAVAQQKEDPIDRSRRANSAMLGYWVVDTEATRTAWASSELLKDEEIKKFSDQVLEDMRNKFLHVQRRNVVMGDFSDNKTSTSFDKVSGQGNYDEETWILREGKETERKLLVYTIDQKQMGFCEGHYLPKHKVVRIMAWVKISEEDFKKRMANPRRQVKGGRPF